MGTCRDKQTEAKARLDACEKVLAAGKAGRIHGGVRCQAWRDRARRRRRRQPVRDRGWRATIKQPHVEVRKLFDLVRDGVCASKHQQQPFTYGSPPGREDFHSVAGK
jgi:hypothetical protein